MSINPKFFQQSKSSNVQDNVAEKVPESDKQTSVPDYPEYVFKLIALLRTLEGTAQTLQSSVNSNKDTTEEYKKNFNTITANISNSLDAVKEIGDAMAVDTTIHQKSR